MATESTDSLSDVEKRDLEQALTALHAKRRRLPAVILPFVVAGIAWVVLFGGAHLLARDWVDQRIVLVFSVTVILAVAAGIVTAWSSRESRDGRCKVKELLARDIEGGGVSVLRVEVMDLVQIDEPSDGRWRAIYRVGDDECMVLREEECPIDDCTLLLRRSITLRILPHTRDIIGLTATGDELRPTGELLPADVDKDRFRSAEIFRAEWHRVVSGDVSV